MRANGSVDSDEDAGLHKKPDLSAVMMLCCRQSRTEDMTAITAYSCIPLVNTRPWRGLSNAELHTQGIASAICYLPVRIGLQQLKHCHQT